MKSILKHWKPVLILGFIATSLIAGGIIYTYTSYGDMEEIKSDKIPLKQTTQFLDKNGLILDEIHGEEHRKYITLDKISPNLINAIIAIEDKSFYDHHGISFRGIGRAITRNFISGGKSEGASTLTMQLVRNLYLTKDKTFERKFKEMVIAEKLEFNLSKEQILELYLNTIYFGHNNYGIQTASMNYFSKPAKNLDINEAAMLAGIVKGPSVYSPMINYKLAKERQKYVLDAMEAVRVDSKGEKDYLPGTTADAEYAKPLKLNKTSNSWLKSTNPSVTDTAILETKKLLKALNKNNSILDKDLDLEKIDELGLKIYTTVDKKTQDLAEKTVKNSCRQFKNPETNIALVSIDPESHQTRAIVGGCHIDKDYVNRANNSKRQAGSSFKVFVYGAAFQAGYKTSSPVNDSPRSFDGGTYTPKNYGGGFSGKTTFGEALIKSMNVPAVVIGQRKSGDKKIVELAIDFARSVGITTPLDPVTSLPLGSKEVIPIEMANAYATIANGGNFAKSTVIYRIVDSSGRIIVDNTNRESKKVLKTEGLIELHKALKGVVTRGTGTKANIGRPTIGKTGTTENQGDVWFVGSTPQLATAVWIGNNKSTQKLGAGATGGGFAAPVWRNFNAEWHKDKPVQDFNLK